MDATKALSGGVTFFLQNALAVEYIPTMLKSKWEEWRHDWFYIHFSYFHSSLAEPEVAATRDDTAKELDARDANLGAILTRIKALRE